MINKKLIKNEHAQAGIGTLIIFIAMILVAAVAAAVLISTSGILQQKAQKTGTETIAEVSSNVKVISLVGDRGDTSTNNFVSIAATVETAAGAGRIDINQFKLAISDGAVRIENLTYGTTANATHFSVTAYRDADSSFNSSNPVINSGDLVVITIDPTPLAFDPRTPYRFQIVPEFGTPVTKEGTTPTSYGVDRYITLE